MLKRHVKKQKTIKYINFKRDTFKYHVFCTDGKISVRINLPLFSTVVPSIICMFLSCNVVITTKGLQDRNIHILDATTMENKGKLILTEIFPSVQKT